MPTIHQMQADFEKALRTMDQFTAGQAPVQKAARKIARALDELGIPMVLKASGQTTHKPIRAVHPSQEHDATVAGNPITGEVDGDDRGQSRRRWPHCGQFTPSAAGSAAQSEAAPAPLHQPVDQFLGDPGNRGKVAFFGASNRPDLLDDALKRSGRIDAIIRSLKRSGAEKGPPPVKAGIPRCALSFP